MVGHLLTCTPVVSHVERDTLIHLIPNSWLPLHEVRVWVSPACLRGLIRHTASLLDEMWPGYEHTHLGC